MLYQFRFMYRLAGLNLTPGGNGIPLEGLVDFLVSKAPVPFLPETITVPPPTLIFILVELAIVSVFLCTSVF